MYKCLVIINNVDKGYLGTAEKSLKNMILQP